MNTNFKIGEYYQHGKAQTVVLITDLEAMPHTDLAIIVVAQIIYKGSKPVPEGHFMSILYRNSNEWIQLNSNEILFYKL